MNDEGDRSSLLRGQQGRKQATGENPLYHDSTQSPTTRLMQLAFVSIITILVLITVILSIYRAATVHSMGGYYFLLGLSLIGFVAIEISMILLVRRGDLPKEKTWFLYFVGGCVVLEAIFTNILLFK